MMDIVQSAAVATANVVLPRSGAIVNSAFELGKICYQVGLVLNGMQKSAPSIKTQRANIEEDVSYFRWVLEVLEQRVQNQELFTSELQKLISKFETEVNDYDRVMKKFLNKSVLKQLVFHSDLDAVSDRTRKTSKDLCERINTESSISASAVYAKQEERANRYMKLIDSPEVMTAMSDADNQKEILAIIARMGRRNEAMMESPLETNDVVLNVMKEKLWASSSRAVQEDVKNLPDWYMTEDEVEIDMSAIIGFGGDAKVYRGVLEDGTIVAVKVFNANVQRSEQAKHKFFSTMKLWVRLSHFNNVCRLYGACYFTATPFIVMEYCEMGSLDTYLRHQGVDRASVSIGILTQAARAVVKMHSKGFVHGDLKCDNILVTGGANPQAKLGDFDHSFDWSALKSKRLVNGTAVETGVEITDAVRYLAPECVEGGGLPNSKSDVYSFGMTLYQALSGVSPYSDISCDSELRNCKLARELPPQDARCIGEAAWKLITKCCDPAPDQRPTMEKVLTELKTLKAEQATETAAKASRLDVASMDVQANVGHVLVPIGRGMKQLSPKNVDGKQVKSRGISRAYKLCGAVILATVVICGIVVWIVTGTKPTSSVSTNSSTGSSSSGGSNAGADSPSSNSGSSAGPTPTPTSTSTPVLSGRQVSTLLTYNTHTLWGIAVASDGNVYLSALNQILRMTGDSAPLWYAGNVQSSGYQDDTLLHARFGGGPLALSPSGDLFLCDNSYLNVLKITTTKVGALASLVSAMVLQGIALDSSGNVYVSRAIQSDVAKIAPDGSITTFANSSRVINPMGIAIDSSDNIYVTDQHRVLKFTLAGEMTVLAGGTQGFVNAVGESARFSTPWAVAVGSDGDLYVADSDNNCIRRINPFTREVTTYAGICGTSGAIDGLATNATFEMPFAIAAAANNVFYVTDGPYRQGYRLRKLFTA